MAHHPSTRPQALRQDDCTSCRVLGTATFLGLSAFTYFSGQAQIQANADAIRASKSIFGLRSRRAAITGTSAVMLGLAVYRWFA